MNSHKDEIRESTGVQNFTHILLQKHETIRVMFSIVYMAPPRPSWMQVPKDLSRNRF